MDRAVHRLVSALLCTVLLGGCVWTHLTWPPQGTTVLPCLYSDVTGTPRPDEQFFLSPSQPVVVEEKGNPGGLYRSIEWGPFYFISRELIFGDPYPVPDGPEKVWGLQWYEGIAKVDATRTFALNSGVLCGVPMAGYVYTTTPKEMRAFRFRELNYMIRSWADQGGT